MGSGDFCRKRTLIGQLQRQLGGVPVKAGYGFRNQRDIFVFDPIEKKKIGASQYDFLLVDLGRVQRVDPHTKKIFGELRLKLLFDLDPDRFHAGFKPFDCVLD
jgi:hypothetical protein